MILQAGAVPADVKQRDIAAGHEHRKAPGGEMALEPRSESGGVAEGLGN
ncbi:MAG TPA: hypothetical protein VIK04_05615 [Solirubrobacteraceae bacterium]